MNDRTPLYSTHPELSYGALHMHTHVEAHLDSEESVQYERRRVSMELEPALYHELSRSGVNASGASQATPSFASLRSRDTSLRRPNTTSQEVLRRHVFDESTESIQQNVPGASENGEQSVRSSVREPHWYNPAIRFWTTHVCPTLEEGAYRDHLALERTFLGYLRTSLILVMTGVVIAQLFYLQRSPNPNLTYGFYVIGRPLSATFISMAIVVMLVGTIRFWRVQRALLRGKALMGGWEVLLVMGLCALLVLGTFALVLGVEIDKSYLNG